jgi:hypothetical protein
VFGQRVIWTVFQGLGELVLFLKSVDDTCEEACSADGVYVALQYGGGGGRCEVLRVVHLSSLENGLAAFHSIRSGSGGPFVQSSQDSCKSVGANCSFGGGESGNTVSGYGLRGNGVRSSDRAFSVTMI